ncbi:MAG: restriction endonuclease subunit S [Bacteroidia bacterium]|nr:restriction endonuclease subunit S [Bacteroidia bacterium]
MSVDKYFLLNRGELGIIRWDPNYHLLYEKFLKTIEKSPYKIERLGKAILRLQYGSSSLASKENGGYPMLRMLNLQDEEWRLNDLKYIQFDEIEFKRYKVRKGDILFNRTNSKELVGKCAVFHEDGDWVFASYFIRVELDNSKLLPEYVSFFINSSIGRMQIDAVSRQIAGMTNVNAQEVRALKIPVPPIDEQERIAKLYTEARIQRKSTEHQSAKLLDGIDDYLLNELGISLPPEPANTIENRTFNTSFTKVSGNRFDPFFNKTYFYDVKESIAKGNYGAVFLKQILSGLLVKGYLPKQEEKEGDNKVVQINSINMDGTIDLDNLLTAKDVFNAYQELKQDDILVVITGATIGKVGYWSYPGKYYLGGDIVKFLTDKSKFDPYFVYAFLRCKPSQIEIKRNVTGATNGHLSPDDVKHLLIPSPPLSVQQMIAKEVRVRTEEAHQLLVQAKMDFEAAKKEIEKLILNTAS